MSGHFDSVWIENCGDASEHRENPVRPIGEILPFVLAKYGIDDAMSLQAPAGVGRRYECANEVTLLKC
jgi:hypothetical protein